MNQLKDSMSGVIVHSETLFASSWVALYCLLRNSFEKGHSETEAKTEHDGAGDNAAIDGTRH